MSAGHFRRLCRTDLDQWVEADLERLTAQELAGLCQMLGIPHSGTKERLRERIWRARHLRLVLASYELGADHEAQRQVVEALAASYRADELLSLCRAADVYAGTTKYSRAAALLQWRDACRQRGQEAWAEARAAAANQPKQHRLL
ncbi:MAG: hypothetical protein HGA45_21510 [Chloroflexales bacterium]|nr:hypothetical protein [Chloroflexales bacterium]